MHRTDQHRNISARAMSFMFKMELNKKGVSSVIATVLLILVTISAISIIAGVIIPFVKDNLTEGGSCLTVSDELSIISEESCYDISDVNTNVRIRAGNIDLEGLYIVIEQNSQDISYEIYEGQSYPEINGGAPLKIPKEGGGEINYLFNFRSGKVSAGIIKNEEKCPASDETYLNAC